MLRDLERQLPAPARRARAHTLDIFCRAVSQEHGDGLPRVYATHQPQTYALGKGKDRVAWEFGSNVTVIIDPKTQAMPVAINLANKHSQKPRD